LIERFTGGGGSSGVIKVKSIWDNNKLITVGLFGGGK